MTSKVRKQVLEELAGGKIAVYEIDNDYARWLIEEGLRPGDRVIIAAFGQLPSGEAKVHKPRLIYLDEHNNVVRSTNAIPVQAA